MINSLAVVTGTCDVSKDKALSLTGFSGLSTEILVDVRRLDCASFISYRDLLHSLLVCAWATQTSTQPRITKGVIIATLLYVACLALNLSLIYLYLSR